MYPFEPCVDYLCHCHLVHLPGDGRMIELTLPRTLAKRVDVPETGY